MTITGAIIKNLTDGSNIYGSVNALKSWHGSNIYAVGKDNPYRLFSTDETGVEMVNDTELDYLEEHFVELREKYPEEWIAIVKQEVVAHSLTAIGLRDELDKLDIHGCFITQMPAHGETLPPLML